VVGEGEEAGDSRDGAHVPGYPEEYRWQAIRGQLTGCEIDDVFREYLGKEAPRPSRI
jgi:hypothetical protein